MEKQNEPIRTNDVNSENIAKMFNVLLGIIGGIIGIALVMFLL